MPGPMITSSLLDLIQAIQAGLDPNQGLSILGGLQQQQAQQQAQRQSSMMDLVNALTEQAAQGASYRQAKTLASAQLPNGIAPRIQNALDALYPVNRQPGQAQATAIGTIQAQPEMVRQPMSPLAAAPLSPYNQAMAQQQGAPVSQQDQLAQAAQQQMLPIIINSFVAQAVRKLQPQQTTDSYGRQQTTPGMAPEEIIGQILADPTFKALDPTSQLYVIQSVQDALQKTAVSTQTQAQQAQPGEISQGQQWQNQGNAGAGSPGGLAAFSPFG